ITPRPVYQRLLRTHPQAGSRAPDQNRLRLAEVGKRGQTPCPVYNKRDLTRFFSARHGPQQPVAAFGGELRRLRAYNPTVRRLLAAGLLVLFTWMNAMDGICCPDGCTHEQQAAQHKPESVDGICMLCLGGVDTTVSQDLEPSGIVAGGVQLPPLPLHLDATPPPVERPP